MTEKELSQYKSLKKEIEELDINIKSMMVHDMVVGSDTEFPYTQHTMSLYGNPDYISVADLSLKKARCQKAFNRLDKFIDSIEDSLVRRIFRLRYIEGLEWEFIAAKIGGGNTRDSVRMQHKRFLQKI